MRRRRRLEGVVMNTRRPSIGNTVAIGRFNDDGPTGYVAIYNDGSYGPVRDTRSAAEADYKNREVKS